MGVFAKHDGAPDDTVQFDAFNVVSGADPQTPGDNCGGSTGCPQTDEFTGTTVDPKWALVNPITGANPTVSNGRLQVPLRQADFYAANGNAQILLQQRNTLPIGRPGAQADHIESGRGCRRPCARVLRGLRVSRAARDEGQSGESDQLDCAHGASDRHPA